jgi:hypothetical protein
MRPHHLLFVAFASALMSVAALSMTALPVAAGDPSDDLEARGIITAMPEGTRFGAWTIGGHVYQAVTGTTFFNEDRGTLALNTCAEVKYVAQGAGRLALRIKSDDTCDFGGGHDDHDDDVETKGVVESFPPSLIGDWRVSGITYTATASTTFVQRDGPFAVGACVEVKHPVSSTVALSIKTEDGFECGPNAGGIAKARGTLTAFPPSLIGTWVVNTTTYQVVSATRLSTRHGEFYLGACVEVHYLISDTNRTATEIETESPDDCGRSLPITPTLEARGVITGRPPTSTLFGTWHLGGHAYLAITGTTKFKQEHGELLAGACAKVHYVEQAGARLAVRLSSEEPHSCRAPGEDNELHGAITSLPGTPDLLGVWGIGGRNLLVTETTILANGPFTIGLVVEAHYTRAADGTLIATRIEGKHGATGEKARGKAYGILQSRPASPTVLGTWVVASATYSVTAATRLRGPLQIGDCVEVHYATDASGARLARKIKTESGDDCMQDGRPARKAYGFVQQMPPSGFVGTWLIGGASYDALASTRFEQKRGALRVGAYVEVHYDIVGGVNVARKIETHVPPQAGAINAAGTLSFAAGRQPGSVAPQVWLIDGQAYTVWGATQVDEAAGALVDGARVAVNAYLDAATGNRVATRVAVLGAWNAYLPMIQP